MLTPRNHSLTFNSLKKLRWAKENLSPKARMRYYAKDAADVLRQMPRVLNDAKTLMDDVRTRGFTLSPETIATMQSQRDAYHRAWLRLGWAALIILTALFASDLYLILE